MKLSLRRGRGWVAIGAVIVVVDQITKAWAVSALSDRDIDVFWTLRLNLSFNTGMAFSAGRDWGPLIGVVALAVVGFVVVGVRQPGRLADAAVGLIVGGAIGNVIDRLVRDGGWFRGGVVDFIDFQWFPIFNVADMAITIGGAVLVLASIVVGPNAAGTDVTDVTDGSDPST